MTQTAPHIDTATDPIHTPEDLRDRWLALMSPLGFGGRLLWYAFVGPDRCLIKALHQIDVGPVPRPNLVAPLMESLREVVDALEIDVTVAVLLTRPGSDGVMRADRQWAVMLTGTAERNGVRLEPIFRANDRDLVQITT